MRLIVALWLVVVASRLALALPDLTPEVDFAEILTGQTVGPGDVAEGCAAAETGRTLVRFGVLFHNVGADPLIVGDPMCPDCISNPNVVCGDPRFICSPADGHNHPHYSGFAHYQLLDLADRVLAVGHKESFCIRETECPEGTPTIFTCDYQGIQSGCFDYYDPSLGCQYIDATGVPNVLTRAVKVHVTLDPNEGLPDADRSNNEFDWIIPGCGDGVLQDGETCDPGPTETTPCCEAACCLGSCAARPEGELCRAARDACDAPETCDGVSASCPADASAPDGTPCGVSALPCGVQQCAGGECTSQLAPGWCVIDEQCVAAGTERADGCGSCDPTRVTDAWSMDFTPDPTGIRCRLTTLMEGTDSCDGSGAQAIARQGGRVELLLGQLADPPRLGQRRKLRQRAAKLFRIARLHACETADALKLLALTRAYLSELRGH